MKRLLIPIIMAMVMLLVGCNHQSKVTILANYSIQHLENDPTVLLVDLKGSRGTTNLKAALNDIVLTYGQIKAITSCSFYYTTYWSPTTHLIVVIEPFNPPKTMAGPTPYPDPNAPSRAGAK